MLVSGEIVVLVDDKPKSANRIQYGFVKMKGMKENVFFNTLSNFDNTSFESLNIGDRVRVLVKETARGPFAERLALFTRSNQKETPPAPEASA